VYLGGALWQMLQSAVNGVDESAMLCVYVVIEKDCRWKENVRVEDDLTCESCDVSLVAANSVLMVQPCRGAFLNLRPSTFAAVFFDQIIFGRVKILTMCRDEMQRSPLSYL
jgi:hypothetical protein